MEFAFATSAKCFPKLAYNQPWLQREISGGFTQLSVEVTIANPNMLLSRQDCCLPDWHPYS